MDHKKRRWIMKMILPALTVLALVSGPAFADPDQDESGKGRWGKHWDRGDDYARYDREYKEEFWVGNCKIERKWEPNGGYKEERKCEGGDWRQGYDK